MHAEEHEKHCATQIKIRFDEMRGLWSDATDNQRIEMIKSIIWTAPNMCSFYQKVQKILDPKKFERTLD